MTATIHQFPFDRRARQMLEEEQRRDAFEISEHDGEFYFHGFDRPFSHAELLLIAAQCEARGTGAGWTAELARLIVRELGPVRAFEFGEMVRAGAVEAFK